MSYFGAHGTRQGTVGNVGVPLFARPTSEGVRNEDEVEMAWFQSASVVG